MNLFANGSVTIHILDVAIFCVVTLFIANIFALIYVKRRVESRGKAYLEAKRTFMTMIGSAPIDALLTHVQDLTDLTRDALIDAITEISRVDPRWSERIVAIVAASDIVAHYVSVIENNRNAYRRAHAYLQLARLPITEIRSFLFVAVGKELQSNVPNKVKASGLLALAPLCRSRGDIYKFMEFLPACVPLSGGFVEGTLYQASLATRTAADEGVVTDTFRIWLSSYGEQRPILYALLAVVGKMQLSALATSVVAFYESPAAEEDSVLKVICLRALNAMRADKALVVPIVLEAFHDADWRVRATACNVVGDLRLVNAVPQLRNALSDAAFYVRLNAARALLALGETSLLERFANPSLDPDHSDPYRASICNYILNTKVLTRDDDRYAVSR